MAGQVDDRERPLVSWGEPRLPARFWDKVQPCPMSGCWIWVGAIQSAGYGLFLTGSRRDGSRRMSLAHRVAFVALVGEVPSGLELDHLCQVTCCCNPVHLEPVTHRENIKRSTAGQIAAARNKAKTHCPRGHEYSADNTRTQPTKAGGINRLCITCRRLFDRARSRVRPSRKRS